MTWLGEQKSTVFIGQAVEYPGTAMTNTLTGVPKDKLLELPVEEDFQLGFSLGVALNGFKPISIFPRWNFLLLAMNQLVNHLDKFYDLLGPDSPSVIVRTSVGSQRPLHPGSQHVGNFTQSVKDICPNIDFVELLEPEEVMPAYEFAFSRADRRSTVLVEWGDFHNEK
jgi:pyruvate/2-oxoglutarate/acetoin dehydrogenase E1 component